MAAVPATNLALRPAILMPAGYRRDVRLVAVPQRPLLGGRAELPVLLACRQQIPASGDGGHGVDAIGATVGRHQHTADAAAAGADLDCLWLLCDIAVICRLPAFCCASATAHQQRGARDDDRGSQSKNRYQRSDHRSTQVVSVVCHFLHIDRHALQAALLLQPRPQDAVGFRVAQRADHTRTRVARPQLRHDHVHAGRLCRGRHGHIPNAFCIQTCSKRENALFSSLCCRFMGLPAFPHSSIEFETNHGYKVSKAKLDETK
mmetsp:Transcript_46517/g.117769  ORF Transcript_46517/g.117769 Transcript_46517/m.117769 type:complete len:261 (-) Transcript_46517:58-840(-)